MHFVSLTLESPMFPIHPSFIKAITGEITIRLAKSFIDRRNHKKGYDSYELPEWIFYLLCQYVNAQNKDDIRSLIIWEDDTMIAYIKNDNVNALEEHTVFTGASVLES